MKVAPTNMTRFVQRKRRIVMRRATNRGDNFTSRRCIGMKTEVLPSVRDICHRTRVVVGIGRPVTRRCPLVRRSRLIFACFRFTYSERLASTVVGDNTIYLTCRAMRASGRRLPLLVPVDRMTKEVTVVGNTCCLRGAGNNGNGLVDNIPNIGHTGILILNNKAIKRTTTEVTAKLNTSI